MHSSIMPSLSRLSELSELQNDNLIDPGGEEGKGNRGAKVRTRRVGRRVMLQVLVPE